MATSFRPRTRLCHYRIAWPRKPTPRIKQHVASYHTTEVIAHQRPQSQLWQITSQNWLSWQYPSAHLDSHLTHDSLGPSKPKTQTASRSVQPFLHSSPQSVPILHNGTPLSPSKLPLPMGIWTPSNTYGSLGPPESKTQTASRSVQPFLQGSIVRQTDRQTARPTDHATRSVTVGYIYIRT